LAGRADRVRQRVATGKCFICQKEIDKEYPIGRFYCLYHGIRRQLKHRELFWTKAVYRTSNSRVQKERRQRRPLIVSYLRARFLAVHRGHIEPFVYIREALFFIDKMWDDLALHHSFVFRNTNLSELVRFLFTLDYQARKGSRHKSGWVGSKENIQTWRDRKKKSS